MTVLIVIFIITRFMGRRRGVWPVVLGSPTVWRGGSRRGGGFSGGGGSFGGGGASGRW
ncbi:MAG: hypothetical protein AB7H70_18615 [Rhodospirillaceae bacterium]